MIFIHSHCSDSKYTSRWNEEKLNFDYFPATMLSSPQITLVLTVSYVFFQSWFGIDHQKRVHTHIHTHSFLPLSMQKVTYCTYCTHLFSLKISWLVYLLYKPFSFFFIYCVVYYIRVSSLFFDSERILDKYIYYVVTMLSIKYAYISCWVLVILW